MIILCSQDHGSVNGVQEAESSNLSTQTQETHGFIRPVGSFVYAFHNENPCLCAVPGAIKGAERGANLASGFTGRPPRHISRVAHQTLMVSKGTKEEAR